ncbi:peptidase [Brevibacillus reuszeri]|uniref:peptidase n=1 Tax=Brevibacillus reuszeri TaxID=54915 RepID=UPI001914506F|nr:peptidase [Brevibacillus reuszeri]
MPVGYMGGQAYLYDKAGNLKAGSTMVYNSDSISAFHVYSPRISTYGEYYAFSRADFYNGNGYTRYAGNKSPIQTLNSSTFAKTTEDSKVIEDLLSKTEYDVNDNGETYGSGLSILSIGEEPDLISAIGTNGVKGYVRAIDLTPEVSSIEEAIEANKDNGDISTIPLYDVDGTTVLGEFELVTNFELDPEKK